MQVDVVGELDLDLDARGRLVDDRRGVARAAERQVVVALDGLAAVDDRDAERRGAVVVVGDLGGLDDDGEVGVGLDGLDGDRQAERAVGGRQGQAGGLTGRLGVGHADDVREAAAVEEVAVHGQGQHRTLDEAAVQGLELGPAGHEPRREALRVVRVVQRRTLGEPDECGHSGRRRGQDLLGRGDLFDVDAGRGVSGHWPSSAWIAPDRADLHGDAATRVCRRDGTDAPRLSGIGNRYRGFRHRDNKRSQGANRHKSQVPPHDADTVGKGLQSYAATCTR